MSRADDLRRALSERILLLDGATGTGFEAMALDAEAYGGERLAGCPEALVLHRPEAVLELHRGYLEAGADIVETNTFGGTPIVLAEYGLEGRAEELNRRAAELAREACAEAATAARPRWVGGSMGPTTKSLTLIGGATFTEMVAAYHTQAKGLAKGGADVLLIETAQDALNLKAALIACRDAAPDLPVAVSATIEPTGTTLGGQTIEAVAVMVEPWAPLWVGLNCSTGPGPMTEPVRALAALTPSFLSVVPNAGMPDETGRYHEPPERFAEVLERFAKPGWVNLLGGCCGTTAAHIRALRRVADVNLPRRPPAYDPAWVAGGEPVQLRQERPPLIVGERTNALGSRKFKQLIEEERWAEAAEIGRRQVRRGAQVVDVCVADPEGDEAARMTAFVSSLRRIVRAPLMVDTTDPDVLAVALELIPGRPVINSVNLEDGGERLDRVAELARRFGAAVVAGCIDEHPTDGMARTGERKAEIAERLLERLESHGLRRSEILIDPLVFPAATGDPKFEGSARETVDGIRIIKERIDGALTVAGISNVSFGLPAAGRKVINAVFLHHCVQAGLDAAIVNSQALVRVPSLDPEEVRRAEGVLFGGGRSAVDEFVAAYRDVKPGAHDELDSLPPEERLQRMVLDGRRTGLDETLDLLLERHQPLDIINGPLMAGMDEVGRLFGEGSLIVAEVLVSAEVMQAAVDHLRPHLGGVEEIGRGSILLATVRGDVHDIGKNLVGMIMASNGYRVVDLGVQVPSQRLIEAWESERTDLIGLSGLLVRSTQQMVATVSDLDAHGIRVPVLVGGAALNPRFVRERIAPAYSAVVSYARDAMEGLRTANGLLSGNMEAVDPPGPSRPQAESSQMPAPGPAEPARVLDVGELPTAPDLARHRLSDLPLDQILPWLNPQMLFGKHLGLPGSVRRALERGDTRATELVERVEELQDAAVSRAWLRPAGVFQWFLAHGEGEEVVIRAGDATELSRFPYPRQEKSPRRSAADWVHPDPEAADTVALMAVTVGRHYQRVAYSLRQEGRLLDAFALEALALETAEATAEWLHRRLRDLWGFPDSEELTREEVFRARYRGIRLSFGYPACPDLEPQRDLMRLLAADEIGIEVTEGLMMSPEASVSAVVFHHPDAKYIA